MLVFGGESYIGEYLRDIWLYDISNYFFKIIIFFKFFFIKKYFILKNLNNIFIIKKDL